MTDHVKKPRILTVANQKGGVGKTTTAINLGTALAAIGETVLIIDMDPQGNASTGIGVDYQERRLSMYDVMVAEASFQEVLKETAVPRLWVAPATLDLLGVDVQIANERNRNFRVRMALNTYISRAQAQAQAKTPLQAPTLSQPQTTSQAQALADEGGYLNFSYVLIDCPPSLNLLTVNAMAASDAILVPLQCEFFALEGLSQLLNTIEQVKEQLNQELNIHGIVLTMYDARNNLSAQVVEDVRAHMGDLVYDTIIPRNVRVSEAPSYGKPVLLYDLKCSGSQAYLRLASEVIQRERRLGVEAA